MIFFTCCICLCKDTNFKANHNSEKMFVLSVDVVYAYAKILILKQITTCKPIFKFSNGCICLCKDTNFKANHNTFGYNEFNTVVVYAYAKILILKQITTNIDNKTDLSCCICLCKDTNFKANHNNWILSHFQVRVVYAYAKILILKQITTSMP